MNNRVKELRDERGWSQTKLTVKTGITQNQLSMIETGRLQPYLKWKKRIAKAFKLSVEDVFGEKEEK